MKLFFFNEIVPDSPIQDYISALENSVQQYRNLKVQFPGLIDGIVLSSFSKSVILTEGINLFQCLDGITNKELKGYSFSLFQKFPIDDYTNIDTVLTEDINYHFHLGIEKKDALNIKLILNEKGFLFSLNLHADIAKNDLLINSSDGNNFSISNLYGLEENTKTIQEILNSEIVSKLDNFSRLTKLLNIQQIVGLDPVFSLKFKTKFGKVSKEIQNAIIDGFIYILKCKDDNTNISETILKDVTPKKEKKISVLELKIRKPIPKRIYFTERNSKYYIVSLERKPLKNRATTEQGNHIKNARSLINQLI